MIKTTINKNISLDLVLDNLGIKYTRSGDECKLCNPWRDDKNPSLNCNTKTNVFFDFATGESGDIITFYARLKNLNNRTNYRQIVAEINQICGYDDKENITHESDKIINEKVRTYNNYNGINSNCQAEIDKEDISIFSDIFTDFVDYFGFGSNNKHVNQVAGYTFICSRKLESEIYTYSLGSTKPKNKSSFGYAVQNHFKNYDQTRLYESGLFNKHGYLKDQYKNRLIIPYFDNEKVVFLQFRSLWTDEEILSLSKEEKVYNKVDSKYINVNSSNYNRPLIWGLKQAIKEEKTNDDVVITESVLDAISAIKLGYKAIAIGSTSNVNNKLLEELKPLLELNKRLILALDNDQSGKQANIKLAKLLISYGFNHELLSEWSNAGDSKDINQFLINHNYV